MRKFLIVAALVIAALGPVLAATTASASTAPPRLRALWWAERHAGAAYCWGGTGPCFDCSGLVMRAYRHVGIGLPRTTYGMLGSWRLVRVSKANRSRGDLAFYGTGHVELVTRHGTFGALNPALDIGWHHPTIWWHPTRYYRVRRAG